MYGELRLESELMPLLRAWMYKPQHCGAATAAMLRDSWQLCTGQDVTRLRVAVPGCTPIACMETSTSTAARLKQVAPAVAPASSSTR